MAHHRFLRTGLPAVLLIAILSVPAQAPAAEVPGHRLTPEVPAEPLFSTAHGPQFSPAAASNGSDYLVVWLDSRTGPGAPLVFAARVSRAGELLDPTGIALGVSVSWAVPTVAWIGTSYVVVWRSPDPSPETLGIRIAPDGSLLDREPRKLAPNAYTAFATDGRRILITFYVQNRHRGRILDQSLEVISEEFDLATRAAVIAAAAGDEFVIASQEQYTCTSRQCARMVFERVSKSGGSAGFIPFQLELSFPPEVYYLHQADLASDGGSRYLLAYTTPFERGMSAYRFSREGQVGTAIAVTGPKFPREQYGVDNPATVWANGRFYITWTAPTESNEREVWIAEISAEGWLGAPPRPITATAEPESMPTIAASGDSVLTVWQRRTGENDTDLIARFVHYPTAGEFVVAFSAVPQLQPAVASIGDTHLVAWTGTDFGAKKDVLRIARLSARGAPLDGAGTVVHERSIRHSISGPIPVWIASDENSFLVLWSDETRVKARRLARDGQWIDSEPTDTGLTSCFSSNGGLVWNSETYFFAWATCTPPPNRVLGIHLDRTGRPVGPEIPIYTPEYVAGSPSVGFNGSQYLVVWHESFGPCTICLCPPPLFALHAVRVSRGGTVSDRIVVGEAASGARAPVAVGGGVSLVSWSTYADVRATRVSGDGRVLDGSPEGPGIPLAKVPYGASASATWDGSNFLVAWDQQISASHGELRATRLAPDLMSQARETFLIAASPSSFAPVAVRFDPVTLTTTDGVLFAYSRLAPEHGFVRRVFSRLLLDPSSRRRTTRR